MKQPVAYVAEPPSPYLARGPAVIDTSVLVAVLFDEALRSTATPLVSGRVLHAPWLLDHEIANVAHKKRRGGCSEAEISAALAEYLNLDVILHRTTPEVVLPLASAYGLSAYDAAFLCLAARLKVPLVTFDHKLGKAAMRHLRSLE